MRSRKNPDEIHPTTVRLERAIRVLQRDVDPTPTGIAEFLGVELNRYTNWRSADRGLPKAEILDIARRTGCDPYWLFDESKPMLPSDLPPAAEAIARAWLVLTPIEQQELRGYLAIKTGMRLPP